MSSDFARAANLKIIVSPKNYLQPVQPLTAGFFSRVGSLVVIMMMIVATYVHLAMNDPSLFRLQPEKLIIPLVSNMSSCIFFLEWRWRLEPGLKIYKLSSSDFFLDFSEENLYVSNRL